MGKKSQLKVGHYLAIFCPNKGCQQNVYYTFPYGTKTRRLLNNNILAGETSGNEIKARLFLHILYIRILVAGWLRCTTTFLAPEGYRGNG